MSILEQFEQKALTLPQVDCPITHLFADGLYWREILIPAGTLILGHEHKTEHFNVLFSGRVRVLVDGKAQDLVAPFIFVSKPGTRKLIYALEDARWANVHANPTNEQDAEKIDDIFIIKSESFLTYAGELKKLMEDK